jgi:hypothetical protein
MSGGVLAADDESVDQNKSQKNADVVILKFGESKF